MYFIRYCVCCLCLWAYLARQHACWKDREWLRGNKISGNFGKLKYWKLYHEAYLFLTLADASVVGFRVCFKLFKCLNNFLRKKKKAIKLYLATDLKIPAKKANVQYLWSLLVKLLLLLRIDFIYFLFFFNSCLIKSRFSGQFYYHELELHLVCDFNFLMSLFKWRIRNELLFIVWLKIV